MADENADDRLLTPREAAVMFTVSPETLGRWARAGKIRAVTLPSGTRRYWASEIRRHLESR